MKSKAQAFYFAYLFGGFILMIIGEAYFNSKIWILPMALWFLAFGIAQFFILRCPHCDNLAIRTKSGFYVPWTGDHCRYCRGGY